MSNAEDSERTSDAQGLAPTKVCKGPCKRELPLSEFRITNKKKSYRDSLCFDCRAEKRRAARAEDALDMDKVLEARADAAKARWEAAKRAADEQKLPFDEGFDLTHEYIKELYDEQGKCCRITRLPFILDEHPHFSQRPFSPSPDRIDPRMGYVRDNVRLVLWYVNRAFNQYGGDIFMLVAEQAVKHAVQQETLSDEKSPVERMRELLARRPDEKPFHDMTQGEKESFNQMVGGLKDVLAAPDLTIYTVPDPDQPGQLRGVGASYTTRKGEFVDTREEPQA